MPLAETGRDQIVVSDLSQTDLTSAFAAMSSWPRRIWFDSVCDHDSDRGRFSYLTADPVAWWRIDLDQPNPWPQFRSWCQKLEEARARQDTNATLPPFTGGLAGVIGYESGWWLEPSLRPEIDDSTTDRNAIEAPLGMAIGLFDWVIAVDHQTKSGWLISTGVDADWRFNLDRAHQRHDQVMSALKDSLNQQIQQSEPRTERVAHDHPMQQPDVKSNFTGDAFELAVGNVVRRIRNGESFQVNLSQQLSMLDDRTADELYLRLRQHNPAPSSCFIDLGDQQILSSSPESFFRVRDRQVVTRPIKGTTKRTGDPAKDQHAAQALQNDPKERAENIMIVDLMRNDLSRVCDDDSVVVTDVCVLEQYESVQHLVSTVVGQLRHGMTVADLLAASFPGGSITGAPKIEAMKTIRELERINRNAYCGSAGFVSLSGAADFNILIRTITKRGDQLSLPVGGGITARSEPAREFAETWTKASGMLTALQRQPIVDPPV
ncbi:MAG: anthranilate synthase component I family protein [Planctomycetota bacterium]